MKRCLFLLGVMIFVWGLANPAGATDSFTITFDDVATPYDNWGVVPQGYMGFDWDFIEVERMDDYQKTFHNRKISFPSPPLAALNGGDTGGNEVVSFSRSEPFFLEGAFFSTWAQNNKFADFSSKGLTVAGFLDNHLVGSKTFSLTPDFVWQDFDFGAVNLITFTHLEHDNTHWWLMDNVEIAAPLPTTLGLFCGGLLALYMFGRRRAES